MIRFDQKQLFLFQPSGTRRLPVNFCCFVRPEARDVSLILAGYGQPLLYTSKRFSEVPHNRKPVSASVFMCI